MKSSTIVSKFSTKLEDVWKVVTDNTTYSWRSDLGKINISDDEKSFTETTKDGFETEFTITLKKPYERYEFNMENKNMRGHWVGIFSKDGSGTKIEFTEEVETTSPIMNLFVKSYLKKQQATYVADLKKVLCE